MTFKEQLQEGLQAVKMNKTRTVITSMIILLGITALVGILTSVDALEGAVSKTFNKLGSQTFTIRNSAGMRRMGERKRIFPEIQYEQAKWFKENFKNCDKISISQNVSFTSKLQYKGEITDPNIVVTACDANYLLTGLEISTGRNFSVMDEKTAMPVAIIGRDVKYKLFGESSGLGKKIAINGKKCTVIGELKARGSSMGMNGGDRLALVSLGYGRQNFNEMSPNYIINVSVKDEEKLDNAMEEANLYMRQIRRIKAHDEEDYSIVSGQAVAKQAIEQLGMVSTIGAIISAITLLGAAIGLMNIMLVSVTERTREIGLRKAIGARRKNIRNQFLSEAVIICQLGGLGGIVLGILVGNLVGLALDTSFIIPWKWMLLAVVICTIVGLVSGIYPANKAAKLDPIDSLRYE